jgi:hypothetical protein
MYSVAYLCDFRILVGHTVVCRVHKWRTLTVVLLVPPGEATSPQKQFPIPSYTILKGADACSKLDIC